MGSVAHAVVEFDEAVQAPWRPPLAAVAGGRQAASRPVPSYRGAARAGACQAPEVAPSPARHPAAGPSRRSPEVGHPVGGRVPVDRATPRRRGAGSGREVASLRLTRRAHRLGAVLGLAVGVALGTWFGALVAGPGDGGLQLAGESSVVVESGDTVWSIARSVAGDADVRAVVDAIQSLNGLEGAHLEPGQVLRLP